MQTFLSIVQTLSLAAAAAGLLLMGLQLRNLFQFIRHNSLQVTVSNLYLSTSKSRNDSQWGYSVYMWTDGKWVLDADMSAPGCTATVPGIDGSYEGQLVRKDSAPK